MVVLTLVGCDMLVIILVGDANFVGEFCIGACVVLPLLPGVATGFAAGVTTGFVLILRGILLIPPGADRPRADAAVGELCSADNLVIAEAAGVAPALGVCPVLTASSSVKLVRSNAPDVDKLDNDDLLFFG